MKTKIESKAMMEVMDWKEEASKEVEDLNTLEAVKTRIEKSSKTSKKLGFKAVDPMPANKIVKVMNTRA